MNSVLNAASVIDVKTDEHTYGALFAREKVAVTLTLIETDPGQFAIKYEATYSGIKSGHIAGGPVPITGDSSTVVNQNPKVTVIVSNYSNDQQNHLISAHIQITVQAPVLGNITIFDKSLGGQYGINTLQLMFAHMAEISNPEKVMSVLHPALAQYSSSSEDLNISQRVIELEKRVTILEAQIAAGKG
ncbi:hypothetical protein ACL6C3_13905 [Capilliphycus salinus ALCB114379]|uniref:hypothetical protein n=1 Tax=Capilliphycus salinus TaxID=2768948 RepID=UPI0039A70123